VWYRASKYDVVRDSILPADSCEFVKTDPWEAFYVPATPGQRRSGVLPRPYTSFLELGSGLPAEIRRAWTPTKRTREMVTAWVAENGLLGLLAQGLAFVALPGGVDQPAFVPRSGEALSWDTTRCYSLLGAELPTKGAMVTRSPEGWDIVPPGFGLHGFFPTSDPVADDTCWGEKFRRVYGEPLSEIAFEASSFHRFSLVPREPAAFAWLSERAGSALPRFRSQAGRISYEHSSPTLISSFCLMLLWDLLDGLSVATCSACFSPFVRTDMRAHMCSARCRQREKVRRYRARRKEIGKVGMA
jgi:hypothetical protein